MRVLIVEDDRLLGDGLSTGLRALGFSVDWMTCGEHADAALSSGEIDLVVLDLGLPGRDGLDWLKRWRQRAERVPLLILTAPTTTSSSRCSSANWRRASVPCCAAATAAPSRCGSTAR